MAERKYIKAAEKVIYTFIHIHKDEMMSFVRERYKEAYCNLEMALAQGEWHYDPAIGWNYSMNFESGSDGKAAEDVRGLARTFNTP